MFNLQGKLTIKEVQIWMDGGTITILLQDQNVHTCEVEFVQKVDLRRYDNLPQPGSLLLNRELVEVRSELENKILMAVQQAEWGTSIRENEKEIFKKAINECINFIKSVSYIELAKAFK